MVDSDGNYNMEILQFYKITVLLNIMYIHEHIKCPQTLNITE